jgi:hypothetical protein
MAESPSDVGTAGRALVWWRASTCSNNSCVDVAKYGNSFAMRDSHGLILVFGRTVWVEFLVGVIDGEFDLP